MKIIRIGFSIMLSIAVFCTMGLPFEANAKTATTKDEPYIEYISIQTLMATKGMTGLYIGEGKAFLIAVVHMSDGTTAKNNANANVKWEIRRNDKANCYCVIDEAGSILTEPIEYAGINCTTVVAPYGEKEGFCTVTATSKEDSGVSGSSSLLLKQDIAYSTFAIFDPGTTKVGKVTGNRPADLSENYDKANYTYTTTIPKNTYKSKYYDFAGWKIGDRIYQPGDKYTASASEGHVYFTAVWKARFKTPDVTVARKKTALKVKWSRMVGSKGYTVYRSVKKGGKYRKVKTITKNSKTSWTDKKVKSYKKYHYKVAAYKKSGDKKTYTKKSYWVMAKVNASSVKKVRLNRSKVNSAVGKTIKVKAKVYFSGNRKADRKVRWYSSNKKIASVSRGGKITMRAKGSCRIWAKAHNGKNSKKIAVTVR